MKQNLLGLDVDGLRRFFEEQGEKPFRARQVLRWIHQSVGVPGVGPSRNVEKSALPSPS